MARIVVTSDLHHDSTGRLTSPASISALAVSISELRPDAVVIAGDLGHPFDEFCACLDKFLFMPCPVGVVCGNHDVWRDPDLAGSQELWAWHLPRAVRERGFVWLEEDTLFVGRTALVGSLAWYDYSGHPEGRAHPELFWELKRQINNDSLWVDWPWNDVQMAAVLREGLWRRLAKVDGDPDVDNVVVVTHVPVFNEQLAHGPARDPRRDLRPWYAHLTAGAGILGFAKVCAVVSGHAHRFMIGQVQRNAGPPIRTWVVGSDYRTPSFLLVDTDKLGLALLEDHPSWDSEQSTESLH